MDYNRALEILELDEGFSKEDAKQAYRKIAMKVHPDKGGSSESFLELAEAFTLLEKMNAQDGFLAVSNKLRSLIRTTSNQEDKKNLFIAAKLAEFLHLVDESQFIDLTTSDFYLKFFEGEIQETFQKRAFLDFSGFLGLLVAAIIDDKTTGKLESIARAKEWCPHILDSKETTPPEGSFPIDTFMNFFAKRPIEIIQEKGDIKLLP